MPMFFSIQTIANNTTTSEAQKIQKAPVTDHQGSLTPFSATLDNATIATGVLAPNVKQDISDVTRTLYSKMTQKVSSELDSSLPSREKAISYTHKTIDAILNEPIEVKMTPQDLKRAIIFARLGIDYEKVKELEVKIDMLTLAKEEVEESKVLTATDKAPLIDRIELETAQLQDQIAQLMKGNEDQELDALEQVLFGKPANADAEQLLDDLQQASRIHLTVRTA